MNNENWVVNEVAKVLGKNVPDVNVQLIDITFIDSRSDVLTVL